MPGIAVATDRYGEGVLPIMVPGDRFQEDKTLDITLILQADRLAPDPLEPDATARAGVAADVRDVIVTVVRTETPQAPPAPPGRDMAKPLALRPDAGPPPGKQVRAAPHSPANRVPRQ